MPIDFERMLIQRLGLSVIRPTRAGMRFSSRAAAARLLMSKFPPIPSATEELTNTMEGFLPTLLQRAALNRRPDVGSTLRATALGRLAGFGAITKAGLTFQNNDAYNDFVGGVDQGGARPWPGVSTSLIEGLERDLAAATGPRSSQEANRYIQIGQAVAERLDELQHFDAGLFGRSEGTDTAYKRDLKTLKEQMESGFQRIQAALAQEEAEKPKPTKPTVVLTDTGAVLTDTGAVLTAGTGTINGGSEFPLVPVLVGGGIFLAGAAFLLLRKRQ